MDNNQRKGFGKDLISTSNEQLVESEDPENRERHEREMHNFSSYAMGDFNYGRQSTSPAVPNEGEYANTLSSEAQAAFEEHYRGASDNERLKALYDARVYEIIYLKNDLEKLQSELQKKERSSKDKIFSLQIENQKNKLSLKDSEQLLAEQFDQNSNLQRQIEYVQNKVQNLESNLLELSQDNEALQEENVKLVQVALMQSSVSPIPASNKELQESHVTRISQLERTVQNYERKRYQYKQIICKLRQKLDESNTNLMESQWQYQELLKTVEKLKQSQQNSEQRTGQPAEELRNLCQLSERLENMTRLRSGVLQMEKSTLGNEELKETLHKKEEEIEDIKQKLSGHARLLEEFAECRKERDYLKERHQELTDIFRAMQCENEDLYQKVMETESRKHSVGGKLIETSLSQVKEKEENNKLLSACASINDLDNNFNNQLYKKMSNLRLQPD